ncbi:MAG: leucine-rich repeat domain-containing protein, partial [Clostridia bacterium]|nr:leucine-rich repeat domain-containing protein [Clostridia bacterium]
MTVTIRKTVLLFLILFLAFALCSAQACAAEGPLFSSAEEAGAYVRSAIRDFRKTIPIMIEWPSGQAFSESIISDIAEAHTGVPDEGDYLRFSRCMIDHPDAEIVSDDGQTTVYALVYEPLYVETPEQEELVTARIRRDMAAMDLDGKSDIDKILAIHEYLGALKVDQNRCSHSPACAYYALFGASCRPIDINILAYRMLLEAGIDNRLILRETGYHAYNLVMLDGVCYYTDFALCAHAKKENFYRWFMRGEESASRFSTPMPIYLMLNFTTKYPLSRSDYKDYPEYVPPDDSEAPCYRLDERTLTLTILDERAFEKDDHGRYSWHEAAEFLKHVVFAEDVYAIPDSAFAGSYYLETVDLPICLESIGADAFSACALKEITIPDATSSIGDRAFEGCSFNRVTIGSGLTEIGEQSFYGCCELEDVTIYSESLTGLGSMAFANCSSLKELDFIELLPGLEPSEQIDLLEGTFYGCTALEHVALSSSFRSIGDVAFKDCSNLKTISLSKGIQEIGEQAFMNCTSLRSIEIPDTVTSIGHNAFNGCSSLERAVIPGSVRSLDTTFVNCLALQSIILEEGIETISYNAFAGCDALRQLTVPASVTTVYANSFNDCPNLTTLVLPAQLNSKSRFYQDFYMDRDKQYRIFYAGTAYDWFQDGSYKNMKIPALSQR